MQCTHVDCLDSVNVPAVGQVDSSFECLVGFMFDCAPAKINRVVPSHNRSQTTIARPHLKKPPAAHSHRRWYALMYTHHARHVRRRHGETIGGHTTHRMVEVAGRTHATADCDLEPAHYPFLARSATTGRRGDVFAALMRIRTTRTRGGVRAKR
jgi:hypothetical protein